MRILLVDDRDTNLHFMAMLCQIDQHEHILVEQSSEVEPRKPNLLIVLDMFLPGQLNGLDVLRALRSTPETADVVLATTAGPDVYTRKDAISAGADDFLIKPFSISEWRTAVNNLTIRHRYIVLFSPHTHPRKKNTLAPPDSASGLSVLSAN